MVMRTLLMRTGAACAGWSTNASQARMRRQPETAMRISLLPVLLLALTAAGDAPPILVEHPWARASAGAAKAGAAYVTITAQSQPDKLTGASTPVAATAELHESMADMGMMKMRPLAGLPLALGKPV